ncbi:MAG: hypothetical protein ACMV1K_08440 [Sulfurospirillum sp.]
MLKKWIFYGGLIGLVFAAQNFLPEIKNDPMKPIVYYKDEKTLKDILSKEDKIKDVTLNVTPGWVYVSVYSDGTKRDGYAEYLCLEVQPHLLEDVYIKIVDHKDVLQKKGFTEIGLTKCKASK